MADIVTADSLEETLVAAVEALPLMLRRVTQQRAALELAYQLLCPHCRVHLPIVARQGDQFLHGDHPCAASAVRHRACGNC